MFREETMLVHGDWVGRMNFVHCGVMDAVVHAQFIRKRAMRRFPENEGESLEAATLWPSLPGRVATDCRAGMPPHSGCREAGERFSVE